MSYASRRPLPSYRPYGIRTPVRPYYGGRVVLAPAVGTANLGGALGAIGGTLACLLCLAAIGALGLFACVIALAVYTRKFLNAYKTANLINGGPGQPEIGFVLLFASLFYAIVCRMQRN